VTEAEMMAWFEARHVQAVSVRAQEVLPMAVMKQGSCAWCINWDVLTVAGKEWCLTEHEGRSAAVWAETRVLAAMMATRVNFILTVEGVYEVGFLEVVRERKEEDSWLCRWKNDGDI